MLDLSGLNKNQLKAVSTDTGPVLVVAGAGTGKTRVLTLRFMYLINTLNFDPTKILAITFTNLAAEQMKKRILNLLNNVRLPWVSTYHSMCLKILREDIDKLGRKKDFFIIDDEDQLSIVKDIFREHNINQQNIKPLKMLQLIGYIKMNQINLSLITSLDQLKPLGIYNFNDLRDVKFAYKMYQSKLIKHNGLDFEDLLILTYELLSKFALVRQKWQNLFQYILVDEFQDTNKIQFEILLLLINPNTKNVFIVGDPDQTIYTWRGAYPAIFKNFLENFPQTEMCILDLNYRSTKSILKTANKLISFNQNRIHKNLLTDNFEGDKPIFNFSHNREEEANFICNKIVDLINQHKCTYGEIAILYRANFLSRFIEQELVNHNIPYRIYGGVKFFQRLEIKDLLAYLKLVVNPHNELALRRVINVPRRGIGKTTIDSIQNYAIQKNISFAEALWLSEKDLDLPWSTNSIRKFLFVINELIKKQQDLNISQMLETIIQMTNYDKHLQSLDFEDRVPNIEELTVAIKEYELQNPHGKIVDYLNEISLYTDNEKNVRNTNGITLMTVHTAKGSEYYAVFVIAFNEGVFPSFKSQDLQEERRIAYVALTRAKKILYLSASQFDNIQGNNMTLSPSRFINEISKSYLEFQQANLINDSYKYTYQPINNHYKVGSIIKHVVFGVGVVISCEKNFITVSFKAPYGVKTLLGDHKAIRKIKN